MKEGCPLCHLEESNFPHFDRYGVDHLDRFTGFESPHFFVKPDVLPNVKSGLHFLLVPKAHEYNLAEFGHTDEVGRILRTMEGKFGPVTIFEHGGIEEGSSNQSIYHAHAHLMFGLKARILDYMGDMLNGQLPPDFRVYDYKRIETPDFAFPNNLRQQFQGKPYLYVQQGGEGIIVHGDTASQITQRAMHLYSDGVIMDWKTLDQRPDLQKESVIRILKLIKNVRQHKT